MKKLISGAFALLLALSPFTSLAEPAVSHGGYTAYLGEENYLYLKDPNGYTMVLRIPIGDIVSLTDTHVYSIAADGRLFGIRLDGQETLILAVAPTEEDLAKVTPGSAYSLTGTVLTLTDAQGNLTTISATTVAACASEDTLYYLESSAGGTAVLKSRPLHDAQAASVTIAEGLKAPRSMLVTQEALTVVHVDQALTVWNLEDGSCIANPVGSEETVYAAFVDGKVMRYAQSENGMYRYEAEPAVSVPALVNITEEEPKATAAPTAKPTATPKPATTSKPSGSSGSSGSSSDTVDRLEKGDRGSEVRKMQRRLSDLGYPVGSVDGVWGDDTQFAVNLFQCAIGYSERTYASEKMLQKLYAKSAPAYDLYAPLKINDKGTDVLLMQTTLSLMGYNPGKLDGIYGANTTAAVMLFQSVCNLPVTGEADRLTMERLYAADCPVNPGMQPSDPATKTDL